MSALNLDIYRHIFDDLPITDKRSLLRTCKSINVFTLLMPKIELEFQKKLNNENFITHTYRDRYWIHSALYKYFVELLYDGRDVPDRYIVGKNELVRCEHIYKTLAKRKNFVLIRKMLRVCPLKCLNISLAFVVEGSFEIGNFKILEWLQEQNYQFPYGAIIKCGANVGNVEVVAHTIKSCDVKTKISRIKPTSKDPVFREIFSFLIDKKIINMRNALTSATAAGDFGLTKYLLAKYSQHKVVNLTLALQNAIAEDHIELAKYVSDLIRDPIMCGVRPCSINMTEWIMGHDIFARCTIEASSAATLGNLEYLQYMHSNNHNVLVKRVFHSAIISGNVDMIKWLHDLNCSFDNDSIMSGLCLLPQIKHSCDTKIQILDLFINRGVKLDECDCGPVVFAGDLEFLQYVHKNGGIVGENTINSAAQCGYLHIIIWCREIGCPWSTTTCRIAAAQSLDTLKWLRGIDRDACLIKSSEKEICPWDSSAYSAALKSGDTDMVNFVAENMDLSFDVTAHESAQTSVAKHSQKTP